MAWDDNTQIVNCVFTGNEAHNGGAVQMGRNDDGTSLTNCTFYDNKAKSGGAGLSFWWPEHCFYLAMQQKSVILLFMSFAAIQEEDS